MPKIAESIRERINESLSSSDRDSLTYYLETTRAAQKEYADSLRRSATLMVLLMAVFELLVRGKLKQVTVGPFLLSNATTITAFIPAVVAYFYYDCISTAICYENALSAYSGTFAIWNKVAEQNDLDILVYPRAPQYMSAGYASQATTLPEYKTMINVNDFFAVLALFVPIAYFCYAFYQLAVILQPYSVLLWVNVTIAVLFLGAAARLLSLYWSA